MRAEGFRASNSSVSKSPRRGSQAGAEDTALRHEAARIHRGLQRCRWCREPLSRDWSEDVRDGLLSFGDVPRFKPGQHVVMRWEPPYRSIWALGAYPGDVTKVAACTRGKVAPGVGASGSVARPDSVASPETDER